MRKEQSDIYKLQNCVEVMDSLSQEGFSEISAIATLALLAMESREINNNQSNILAHAFQLIRLRANDVRDLITSEAEQYGCNSTREIFGKIIAAQSAESREGAA